MDDALEPTFARLCPHIESEARFAVGRRGRDHVHTLVAAHLVSADLRVDHTISLPSVALVHIDTRVLQQVHGVSLGARRLFLRPAVVDEILRNIGDDRSTSQLILQQDEPGIALAHVGRVGVFANLRAQVLEATTKVLCKDRGRVINST